MTRFEAGSSPSSTAADWTSPSKWLKRKHDADSPEADEVMKALNTEEQDAVLGLLNLSHPSSTSAVQAHCHTSLFKPSPLQAAKNLVTCLLVSFTPSCASISYLTLLSRIMLQPTLWIQLASMISHRLLMLLTLALSVWRKCKLFYWHRKSFDAASRGPVQPGKLRQMQTLNKHLARPDLYYLACFGSQHAGSFFPVSVLQQFGHSGILHGYGVHPTNVYIFCFGLQRWLTSSCNMLESEGARPRHFACYRPSEFAVLFFLRRHFLDTSSLPQYNLLLCLSPSGTCAFGWVSKCSIHLHSGYSTPSALVSNTNPQ